MHCTLFGEDGGKRRALDSVSYRMSYQHRQQYLVTEQKVQNALKANQHAAWNISAASKNNATISAVALVPKLHKEHSRNTSLNR